LTSHFGQLCLLPAGRCWPVIRSCQCLVESAVASSPVGTETRETGANFFSQLCVCVCASPHVAELFENKKEALTIGLKQTKKPQKSLFLLSF
jgi:hypothetical protein